MRLRFGGALLVLLWPARATAVWAQGSTGAHLGPCDRPSKQPIPGASVTVVSKYVQGQKGSATNIDGEFMHPLSVPPGNDYQLTVEGVGIRQGRPVQHHHRSAAQTTLDIELMSRGRGHRGQRPPAHRTSKETKVQTNLTQEELEIAAPWTVLIRTPSTSSAGRVVRRRAATPRVAGGNSTSNVWVVNGLNTTDPVVGTFGSNLNYNFIREMEVTTGGLEAEYGASTGGLFNVLTKSGTNEFHGESSATTSTAT